MTTRLKTAGSPIFQWARELPGDGSRFLKAEGVRCGRNLAPLLADSLISAIRHGTTLTEYSRYRFGDLPRSERSNYIGARTHMRFLGLMNDPRYEHLLEDKFAFHRHFSSLTGRHWMRTADLGSGGEVERAIWSDGRVVAKPRFGKRGVGVVVLTLDGSEPEALKAQLLEQDLDLLESFVVQHPTMASLSNTGVNTLRVITQLNDDVDVLGVVLRVSNGGQVDNASQGGLAARVDLESGRVSGAACVLDPRMPDYDTHPGTGLRFDGFIIPYWEQVVELSKEAARHVPRTRSVGWDVAITADGPVLIEGNHRWMRELWQVPSRRGYRREMQRYVLPPL